MLALFPAGSLKTYVTCVVPTLKKEFGELVLETKVTEPESSDADGSSQLTFAPADPKATVTVMSSNWLMSGGRVSASESETTK